MVISLDQALQGKDAQMIDQINRRRSFPSSWRHKGLLGPENLAKAGFYSTATKKGDDTVRCFCCYKELSNWEENDDPWKEHLDHQQDCQFAIIGKPEDQISVEQMYLILQDRDRHRIVSNLMAYLCQIINSMIFLFCAEKIGTITTRTDHS